MELRDFKADSPELFRRIKNLPLRCRVGRKDRTRDNTTLSFIRNKRRDAFYYISPEKELEELTFVEVARLFHANFKEKSIPLHESHHEQIQTAIADFQEKITAEASSDRIVDSAQGPNEKKAQAFLDMFLKLDITGNEEKRTIQAAKLAIRKGRFTQLQRDINKLQRAVKKTPIKTVPLLDKLLAILEKYPLDAEENAPSPLLTVRSESINPEIIISESFSSQS